MMSQISSALASAARSSSSVRPAERTSPLKRMSMRLAIAMIAVSASSVVATSANCRDPQSPPNAYPAACRSAPSARLANRPAEDARHRVDRLLRTAAHLRCVGVGGMEQGCNNQTRFEAEMHEDACGSDGAEVVDEGAAARPIAAIAEEQRSPVSALDVYYVAGRVAPSMRELDQARNRLLRSKSCMGTLDLRSRSEDRTGSMLEV